MSMAAALSNVPFFHRTGARFQRFNNNDVSNRDNSIGEVEVGNEVVQEQRLGNSITTGRAIAQPINQDSDDIEQTEGNFVNNRHGDSDVVETTQQFDIEDGRQIHVSAIPTSNNSRNLNGSRTSVVSGGDDENVNDDTDQPDGLHRFTLSMRQNRSGGNGTTTLTLAELEEERELARRRSSACLLFALFVLFRLWIMALQEGDFGLLMLCLIGTSWTIRWIRYNQEQAEELSRAIANYSESDNNNNSIGGSAHRHDLRMLSFQAQLALAIMESQRQMMEGGYGHPDGEHHRSVGVTAEGRSEWLSFVFKSEKHKHMVAKGQYGSVALNDDDDVDDLKKPSSSSVVGSCAAAVGSTSKDALEEEPHCSICLGEYEEDEKLIKLPCGHIYHEECISSWCTNHTRCPLCNYDLNQQAQRIDETS